MLVNFVTVMEIATGAVACLKSIPIEKDRTSEREVLPIRRLGSPSRTRTYNLAVIGSTGEVRGYCCFPHYEALLPGLSSPGRTFWEEIFLRRKA